MPRKSQVTKTAGDADARLMLQAAKGSEEAFATLIRRHQRGLLNFFHRLGADVHEAEDAVQEAFLRVFNYRHRYRPEAPFKVFLFTLARHAWVDQKRRTNRWRRGVTHGIDVDRLPIEAPVEPGVRMDLRGALGALSRGHRMVLVLSLYEGLRYEEISAVLDIPIGTVKSRVFHALRYLRERMTVESTA